MRLLKIETKDFRTLQNTTLNFASNYCTISGKNNAGKSCVIKLLLNLFESGEPDPWGENDYGFDYKEDKTKWVKNLDPISVQYEIEFSKKDDPSFIAFLEKQSSTTIDSQIVDVVIKTEVQHSDKITYTIKIDNKSVTEDAASEILRRLKSSDLMFHHNSTDQQNKILSRSRRRSYYEALLSDAELKHLSQAARTVETKIKKLARDHRERLNNLLGRLREKYDVEFTISQRFASKRHFFGIKLNDKKVGVSLNDWGSGTQNRTHILISILQAKRNKDNPSSQDKSTPVVVIEEPECFLHPSAQSEFGKVLRDLSTELGIQIIVTTHSPYMLNREHASSNILLSRKVKKRANPETIVINTSGANWMTPFADHLGIPPQELDELKPLFSTNRTILLVEGEIDKAYFEHLRSLPLGSAKINNSIEIISYGGFSVLKNTALLKFVLSNFDKFFITFDADCQRDVEPSLKGIGLKLRIDYLPVGLNQTGKNRIEGLLPPRISSAVFSREIDLVHKLSSSTQESREAREELKKKLLDEFKKHSDYSQQELQGFSDIVGIINKKFNV
ncbi:MAG: AAA family ATPase [Candidatus Babeliales bacterium]